MPDGVNGANYVVFALQQPFPNDVYRIGFATLYDPRGSILVQPGLKWKPNSAWTVEGFYTYINGKLGSALNLRSEVLKVPHHGSADFSGAFVQAVRSEEHTSELQSLMRISYDA